jgi:hypothetical protein
MSLLGLVILAATAAPDVAVANPLAPGLAGQLECARPDEQKKTCRSLTSYQRSGTGYSNTALILVSPDGPVTIEITAPVTVKGDAVCGVVRAADLDTAKIRRAGRLLDATDAAPLRTAMLGAMASMMGKEICETYQAMPDGLIQRATIDGVREPKGDEPVKWVAPGDGYSVAP